MAIGKIQSKIPEYELLPSIQHVLNASKMSKSIEVQNVRTIIVILVFLSLTINRWPSNYPI